MLEQLGQTVAYDEENNALVILDQTLLPLTVKELSLKSLPEITEAIKSLRLRGAPCIGVSAAIAVSVLAHNIETNDKAQFEKELSEIISELNSARPTAVNLTWATGEMLKVYNGNKDKSIDEIKNAFRVKANEILNDDIARCRKIGEYGAEALSGKSSFLTHCNAGRLACVKYGTALSPFYVLKEQGNDIKVYADETRPLLQGARLTAFELTSAGIDTTVICDNTASYVMSKGLIDAVLVGADRIAANGDTANKIGTSALSVLAKHYGIPFYICAPFSTVDFECESGEGINIEMRDETEIAELWYKQRLVPEAAKGLNPAFDVTDSSLITAFITERGVIPPDKLREYK